MKHIINDHDFVFSVDDHIPQENLDKHPKFERFMEIARAMAEMSSYQKYRLGAVITLRGKVISKGSNIAKTHPQQKRYNAMRFDISSKSNHFLHAEMLALNRAKGIDLTGAEITVYHKGTRGEQKMARPCAACMKAIKDRKLKRVNYSTPDGMASEYISPDNVINVKRSRKPI